MRGHVRSYVFETRRVTVEVMGLLLGEQMLLLLVGGRLLGGVGLQG